MSKFVSTFDQELQAILTVIEAIVELEQLKLTNPNMPIIQFNVPPHYKLYLQNNHNRQISIKKALESIEETEQ